MDSFFGLPQGPSVANKCLFVFLIKDTLVSTLSCCSFTPIFMRWRTLSTYPITGPEKHGQNPQKYGKLKRKTPFKLFSRGYFTFALSCNQTVVWAKQFYYSANDAIKISPVVAGTTSQSRMLPFHGLDLQDLQFNAGESSQRHATDSFQLPFASKHSSA